METVKYKIKPNFRIYPKIPQFRSLYLQICWVLDKTSNVKVVDLVMIYKFDFWKKSKFRSTFERKVDLILSQIKKLNWNIKFQSKPRVSDPFPLDPLSFKPNSLHELCSLIYPLRLSCLQKLEYGSRFERIFELKIDKTETLNWNSSTVWNPDFGSK